MAEPLDDDLPGTCDWGFCNAAAVAWRENIDSGDDGWLPVCETHRTSDVSTCYWCDGSGSVRRHQCGLCGGTGVVPSHSIRLDPSDLPTSPTPLRVVDHG